MPAQICFSTLPVRSVHFGTFLGIPNVLRTSLPLINKAFQKKDPKILEKTSFPHHSYWDIDNHPEGSFQIMDSGMFGFLYGTAGKGYRDEAGVQRWADYYTYIINEHFETRCKTKNRPYFVDIDAQEIIGVKAADALRQKMMDACPNAKWIHVWHPCDGKYGLDKMIEMSDYMAFALSIGGDSGVALGHQRIEEYTNCIRYIKSKKPEIKLHALGMTDASTMEHIYDLIDTCDSTSWVAPGRYGISSACFHTGWSSDAVRAATDKLRPIMLEHVIPWRPMGLKPETVDSLCWIFMTVWANWLRFNTYTRQTTYPRGALRKIMDKLFRGDLDITAADLTEPLYELEIVTTPDGLLHPIPKGYSHITWDMCSESSSDTYGSGNGVVAAQEWLKKRLAG